MSGVRVLVGTKKGAFVLTADGARQSWRVDGPHFGGWEIYHVAGSPADPARLYASQSTGWFGQLIQRSDDGGGLGIRVGQGGDGGLAAPRPAAAAELTHARKSRPWVEVQVVPPPHSRFRAALRRPAHSPTAAMMRATPAPPAAVMSSAVCRTRRWGVE